MFVVSDRKVDIWGKYFHHDGLREYLFPLNTGYDQTKGQKQQLKKLRGMKYCFHLNNYGFHDWWKHDYTTESRLKLLGLTDEEAKKLIEKSMKDLFLETEICPILPMYVFTDDMGIHLERINGNETEYFTADEFLIKDEDWTDWDKFCHRIHRLDNVQRGSLGTGYTDFTGPYDGSASLELFGIELDSGEFLVGVLWEWYNK